jgi:hypothetical protein
MSNSEQPDDSLLKRYLALKALRDNVLYTKPLADTAGGLIEDIPGQLRALGAPLADAASSRLVISQNPEIRRQQIAAAVDKVRGASGSNTEMKNQMLGNAARMAAVSAPVGLVAGGLLKLIGRGKGIGSRLSLLKAPTEILSSGKLNRAGAYKKVLLNAASEGALQSGALGAVGGAMGGLNAGTSKPGEGDIAAASKILQDHPYTSALPGGEISSVFNSYGDGISPGTGAAIGAGLGVGAGTAATFLPPTIKAVSRTLDNPFRRNPKAVNLLDWYARAAKGPMARNALILGGLGGLAGYTVSKHTKPTDA